VVSPATIDRVVTSLTQHELSEDPTTSWPPPAADRPRTDRLRRPLRAVYLLAHGLVKIILVTVLKNQLWAYP
jgi:uncharacterized membrane protein